MSKPDRGIGAEATEHHPRPPATRPPTARPPVDRPRRRSPLTLGAISLGVLLTAGACSTATKIIPVSAIPAPKPCPPGVCGNSSSATLPPITPVTPATSPSTGPSTGQSTGSQSADPTAVPSNLAASSWVSVTSNLAGMASQCGGLTLVSAEPGRTEVLAGVANGGLWSSANGSGPWTKTGTGAGSAQIDNRPSSITYDPSQPGRFWESGIYGNGGFVTQNNGATFKPLGVLAPSDSLSVDLGDPARATMLTGRHEASNVYRSTNGGATWQSTSPLPAGVAFTVAPLVISPQVYLMGTTSGWAAIPSFNAGIYRTTNGGASWTKVYPTAVLGSPLVTKTGVIYWVLTGDRGLVKSTDQGASWQYVTQISSTSGNIIQLPNGWLAAIGRYISVSTDNGVDWTAIGGELPFEASGFTYSPTQKAFYAWQSTCVKGTSNAIPANAIMRLQTSLPS